MRIGVTDVAVQLGSARIISDVTLHVEPGELVGGAVVAAGQLGEVLDAGLVAHVFGVRLCAWTDPATGHRHLSFEQLRPPPPVGAEADGSTRGELAGLEIAR